MQPEIFVEDLPLHVNALNDNDAVEEKARPLAAHNPRTTQEEQVCMAQCVGSTRESTQRESADLRTRVQGATSMPDTVHIEIRPDGSFGTLDAAMRNDNHIFVYDDGRPIEAVGIDRGLTVG